MYAINCYKDLITEIEIAKTRIDGLEGQKKELLKLIGAPQELGCQQYSDLPKGSHNYMSLDRIIDTLHRIDSSLEIENGLLKGMFATQVQMNEKLKGLEGIEYNVVYKRDIENKSFSRIGEELNYSESQASRIYKKIETIRCKAMQDIR